MYLASHINDEFIFYIYFYIRANGTPYYVGKGKNSRCFDKHARNLTPINTSRIVIAESNLSEIGAWALERRYIKWYGRKDLGTGILNNMTDGGDGGTNPSLVTRNKISESLKGRKQSEERRASQSLRQTGRPSLIKGTTTKAKGKPNGRKGLPSPKKGKLSPGSGNSGGTPWNKGIKQGKQKHQQESITCPHCSKTGKISGMKRYHFSNCKLFSFLI